MKARFAPMALALIAGGCVASHAQTAADVVHTPDFIAPDAFYSIIIPPLTNAPFVATIRAEWTRQTADTTTVTTKNHRVVMRDSKGRIYQERRRLAPDGDTTETALMRIEISDPSAHIKYFCTPGTRICALRDYFMEAVTAESAAGPLDENGSRYLSRESLGEEPVAGLRAVGTRETVTTSSGVAGNDAPISVVKEFWYSPELGVNLSVKRMDPLRGTQWITFSALQLQEPDARIFRPPAGYKIVDERSTVIQPAEHNKSGK